MTAQLVHEVSQFLFHEAHLLDTAQFLEWAGLFAEDGVYRIPPTDQPDAPPERALYLVNDDHFRLTERAKRLTKKDAHAEYPTSRVCRTISNVAITGGDETEIHARANFVAYRYRYRRMNIYPGRSEYVLRREGAGFLIAAKTATLAIDALRPHGSVSIII